MGSPETSFIPVTGLGADEVRTLLVAVIKAAFPHAAIPDGPYQRQADQVLSAAAGSNRTRVLLEHGLDSLQALVGGDFAALDVESAEKVLRRVADTDYFRFIRQTVVVGLYEDEEVWDVLGYEGPSFDKGGYLDRGFDDLDWLPDPRVEEYPGPEQWVDRVSELPPAGGSASTTNPTAPAGTATISASELRPGRD